MLTGQAKVTINGDQMWINNTEMTCFQWFEGQTIRIAVVGMGSGRSFDCDSEIAHLHQSFDKILSTVLVSASLSQQEDTHQYSVSIRDC